MNIPEFKYHIKKIVNVDRLYPSNELACLFLSLNSGRKAKTFTKDQLEIIELLAKILDFEVKRGS